MFCLSYLHILCCHNIQDTMRGCQRARSFNINDHPQSTTANRENGPSQNQGCSGMARKATKLNINRLSLLMVVQAARLSTYSSSSTSSSTPNPCHFPPFPTSPIAAITFDRVYPEIPPVVSTYLLHLQILTPPHT